MCRFFAHLCLFLQMIDIPVPPSPTQIILESYLGVLEVGVSHVLWLFVFSLGGWTTRPDCAVCRRSRRQCCWALCGIPRFVGSGGRLQRTSPGADKSKRTRSRCGAGCNCHCGEDDRKGFRGMIWILLWIAKYLIDCRLTRCFPHLNYRYLR